MDEISRRRFLQLSAVTGGALVFGDIAGQVLGRLPNARAAMPRTRLRLVSWIPSRSHTRPRRSMMCTEPTWQSICSIGRAVCWGGRS